MELHNQINLAIKKVFRGQLTEDMLSRHFSETVKSPILKDKALHFMSTIKGTRAYWKNFLLKSSAWSCKLDYQLFYDL